MNIFSNLTSPESIYLFLWLLGAFLIGLIVGWFLWGTEARRLAAELADWKAKYQTLNDEHEKLKVDLSNESTALSELKADFEWKAQRLHDIEAEKGDLHTKIYGLKDQLKAEGNSKLELQHKIEGLSASYNGAKSESEALELKVKGLEAELEAAAKTQKELEEKLGGAKLQYGSDTDVSAIIESDLVMANETIATLNTKIEGLESDINDYKKMVANTGESGTELKNANTRIEVLRGKIDGLNEQLAICKSSKAELQAAAIMSEVEDESETLSVEGAKTAISVALAAIGTASADEKDDLTKINGIGEFIERKLNNLGIYKYAQIANFDEDIIANVTRAIEFFPGRIEKDKWVEQAAGLAGVTVVSGGFQDIIEVEGAPAISKIDVEKAKEVVRSKIGSTIPVASSEDKDDLKIISGVGPFIEEKLNKLGIYTYEQISLFDSELEDQVTNAIEFFPGRIKRDKWVEQARELFKQKKN